jgi:hypothetical protein
MQWNFSTEEKQKNQPVSSKIQNDENNENNEHK